MRTSRILTAVCAALVLSGLACDALAAGRFFTPRPGYVRQALSTVGGQGMSISKYAAAREMLY